MQSLSISWPMYAMSISVWKYGDRNKSVSFFTKACVLIFIQRSGATDAWVKFEENSITIYRWWSENYHDCLIESENYRDHLIVRKLSWSLYDVTTITVITLQSENYSNSTGFSPWSSPLWWTGNQSTNQPNTFHLLLLHLVIYHRDQVVP